MEHHTTGPRRTRPAPASRRPAARRPALTSTALGLALTLVVGCGQGPTDDPSASGSPASRPASSSASASDTPTSTGGTPSPTRSGSPDPQAPTLVVPSRAALPEGPFRVRATSASGARTSISAEPGDVCALEGATIRPVRPGACLVTASAGGLTTATTVQIVKGRPTITWSLRKVTPHSGEPRRHGIRSASDGRVTIRSLTPTQCEIQGGSIKAVARQLDGVASLGPCKVRVDVAETPAWESAQAVLSTRIVEAAVSLSFERVPETLRLGDDAEVVVTLTHPDRSIDNAFIVLLSGCGAFGGGESEGRRTTFRFRVEGVPDEDLEAGRCTLTASTSIQGTVHVVGQGETSATVRLVGAAPSPTQQS